MGNRRPLEEHIDVWVAGNYCCDGCGLWPGALVGMNVGGGVESEAPYFCPECARKAAKLVSEEVEGAIVRAGLGIQK